MQPESPDLICIRAYVQCPAPKTNKGNGKPLKQEREQNSFYKTHYGSAKTAQRPAVRLGTTIIQVGYGGRARNRLQLISITVA